jgi:hypothetical protein
MMIAQKFGSLAHSLPRASTLVPSVSTLALCLLGTLACNGSFDTQETTPSSRPGADARNGALNPNSTAANAVNTDPTGSGEQSNDISGISTGASSRGGARSSRAPRVNAVDAGEIELADAGADDAGVLEVDAGADAGADDAGTVRR